MAALADTNVEVDRRQHTLGYLGFHLVVFGHDLPRYYLLVRPSPLIDSSSDTSYLVGTSQEVTGSLYIYIGHDLLHITECVLYDSPTISDALETRE